MCFACFFCLGYCTRRYLHRVDRRQRPMCIRDILDYESMKQREKLVTLIHLRGFDDVNKTLGHSNADKLICQTLEGFGKIIGKSSNALCLEEVGHNKNYIANVEGVTFAFALMASSKNILVDEIKKITSIMDKPIEFMGLSIELNFLVGSSFKSNETIDTQTLLREAFIAFDSENSIVYKPEMNPYCERRLTLMAQLRQAIENNKLTLFYQPQVSLATHELIGFEALLRWTHEQFGFVPPWILYTSAAADNLLCVWFVVCRINKQK